MRTNVYNIGRSDRSVTFAETSKNSIILIIFTLVCEMTISPQDGISTIILISFLT